MPRSAGACADAHHVTRSTRSRHTHRSCWSMEEVALNALVAIAIFGALVFVMRKGQNEHEHRERHDE